MSRQLIGAEVLYCFKLNNKSAFPEITSISMKIASFPVSMFYLNFNKSWDSTLANIQILYLFTLNNNFTVF